MLRGCIAGLGDEGDLAEPGLGYPGLGDEGNLADPGFNLLVPQGRDVVVLAQPDLILKQRGLKETVQS